MALPDTLPAFTPDEYLAFERSAESKHEYLDGLIYAMPGSSPAHSTMCVNVSEGYHQTVTRHSLPAFLG